MVWHYHCPCIQWFTKCHVTQYPIYITLVWQQYNASQTKSLSPPSSSPTKYTLSPTVCSEKLTLVHYASQPHLLDYHWLLFNILLHSHWLLMLCILYDYIHSLSWLDEAQSTWSKLLCLWRNEFCIKDWFFIHAWQTFRATCDASIHPSNQPQSINHYSAGWFSVACSKTANFQFLCSLSATSVITYCHNIQRCSYLWIWLHHVSLSPQVILHRNHYYHHRSYYTCSPVHVRSLIIDFFTCRWLRNVTLTGSIPSELSALTRLHAMCVRRKGPHT